MSPLSWARKRDFADVALLRREADGILSDREERNDGMENKERRKEERGEDRADARSEGRRRREG